MEKLHAVSVKMALCDFDQNGISSATLQPSKLANSPDFVKCRYHRR